MITGPVTAELSKGEIPLVVAAAKTADTVTLLELARGVIDSKRGVGLFQLL